jgi:predicted nucleotidyltransferase component of viral defense system
MLDVIRKIVSGTPSRDAKIHSAREILQVLVLKILYDKGYFKNLAFVGGTALRLLYGLRRFSEDLDFSLVNTEGYEFDSLVSSVVRELEKWGLSLESKTSIDGIVQTVMLKFENILFDLGLSNHREQKLFIKLEIDSNPPKGWTTEMSLINKHFVFAVTHFDIPSLYATKLHACFFRKFVKGRDFYDLLWYLGKREFPNFELLNNAVEQTESCKSTVDAENFKTFLTERLSGIDFGTVRKDVERFVEDKNELRLLDTDLILELVNTSVNVAEK